jgi:hypothetical protein
VKNQVRPSWAVNRAAVIPGKYAVCLQLRGVTPEKSSVLNSLISLFEPTAGTADDDESLMSVISVNAISYSLTSDDVAISDDVATVQSCDDCVSVLLPRNSLPFRGKLGQVSVFKGCSLRCLFLPQSIDLIGSRALVGCKSFASVYFDCHSSLAIEILDLLRNI